MRRLGFPLAILIALAAPLGAADHCVPSGPMGGSEQVLPRDGAIYAAARIMIVSDPHILAPSLWSEGPAFAEILSNTDALLRALERATGRIQPDMLVIAGDRRPATKVRGASSASPASGPGVPEVEGAGHRERGQEAREHGGIHKRCVHADAEQPIE